MTTGIFDPSSGEVQQAQIFVAVLAASGYTYAEATATQQLPDWIGAHCRAFAFFNGVSQLLVPDNTRTGITKACFYEPDIDPSYLDMAHHYGTAILPARVRKPRDKAMGEGSVQLVERSLRVTAEGVAQKSTSSRETGSMNFRLKAKKSKSRQCF